MQPKSTHVGIGLQFRRAALALLFTYLVACGGDSSVEWSCNVTIEHGNGAIVFLAQGPNGWDVSLIPTVDTEDARNANQADAQCETHVAANLAASLKGTTGLTCTCTSSLGSSHYPTQPGR